MLIAVFGTNCKVTLCQEIVTCNDSLVKRARTHARKKAKGVYRSTKSASNSKITLLQMDIQRDHVDEPLRDSELMSVSLYFLSCTNKHTPYMNAAYRVLFFWGFYALMRGDDVRDPNTTWAHFGIFQGSDIYGPDKPHIFYILKDWSKANEGKTQLCALVRQKNVHMCGVNAIANLLLLTIGRGGTRSEWLHKIFDGNCNWFKDAMLVTTDKGCPLPYSRRDDASIRKRKRQENTDRENNEKLYQYEVFSNMIKDLGLMCHTTTHLKSQGLMYAENNGAKDDDVEKLGRWTNSERSAVMQKHYMSNITMTAMLPMAGFTNPSNGGKDQSICYDIP